MSESQSRKCFDSKLTEALIQCLRGDNRTEPGKCHADFALDFSSLDFFLVFKFFFPTFSPTFFSTFFPTFFPTFFSTFFPTIFRKKTAVTVETVVTPGDYCRCIEIALGDSGSQGLRTL